MQARPLPIGNGRQAANSVQEPKLMLVEQMPKAGGCDRSSLMRHERRSHRIVDDGETQERGRRAGHRSPPYGSRVRRRLQSKLEKVRAALNASPPLSEDNKVEAARAQRRSSIGISRIHASPDRNSGLHLVGECGKKIGPAIFCCVSKRLPPQVASFLLPIPHPAHRYAGGLRGCQPG